MKKKDLAQKLDAKIKDLKSICKDAKFADKLISDILSLKGQMCVEPMEIGITEEQIQKRLKIGRSYGAYELIKFDGGYIFATNGYRLIVKPYIGIADKIVASGLYYAINTYFEICGLPEDEIADSLMSDARYFFEDAIPMICTYPIYNFDNELETISETKRNFKRLIKKAKEASEKLQKDDIEKNEEFKNDVLIEEQIKESING